jgi:hypothetical protein
MKRELKIIIQVGGEDMQHQITFRSRSPQMRTEEVKTLILDWSKTLLALGQISEVLSLWVKARPMKRISAWEKFDRGDLVRLVLPPWDGATFTAARDRAVRLKARGGMVGRVIGFGRALETVVVARKGKRGPEAWPMDYWEKL